MGPGMASELGAREATGGPRYYRLRVAPRMSPRVRCTGSGPSAACRPFSEPSSRTGATPELAIGAREATGGPRYYRLLGGTADAVAGPRPRERAVVGLQTVLGIVKPRRCCLGGREATRLIW